jgi:predicted ArsR family transcriptional regulator
LKETFTKEEAAEQVRKVGRMFGLMFYHFANLLVEEHGDQRGKELVKEAVKRFGLERAGQMKQKAIVLGLDLTVENFRKVSDLPEVGWGGPTKETHCPFAGVWFEKDAVDLCKLYCEVDIWKYVGYNPNIDVKRKAWVLDGDSDCRYEIR